MAAGRRGCPLSPPRKRARACLGLEPGVTGTTGQKGGAVIIAHLRNQRNPRFRPSRQPALQTSITRLTKVPILSIEILTTSPSANVNSGGGIVPVPVQTVVPFGTGLCRCNQSAK